MFVTIVFLAQLAAPLRQVQPVLAFPQPGIDDSASYQGYQTRFYKDAAGNTVQIYIDQRAGRVVHLLADAEDESVGFTAQDAQSRPVSLAWVTSDAGISGSPARRTLEHHLIARSAEVRLGWFVLGSMRVERDFQYQGKHREPFSAHPFTLPEMDSLLASISRLEPGERARHLALLRASDVPSLRTRLQPRISTTSTGSRWILQVIQPSLDGRDVLTLEIQADPRAVTATRATRYVTLRAKRGGTIPLTIRITTTGKALTPLARSEIFNAAFLNFLAAADTSSSRGRWLERQVRGVELLSSREKLMAGLPAYATYFGRDMMLSALMMRPIWRDEMSEFVVASVLRKLSDRGDVSHEEAMGGQAVREAAAEYARLMADYAAARGRQDAPTARQRLAAARDVLAHARRVRENYHMIDDEFQLPVLAARWLTDPAVPAAHKRKFLLDTSDGGGSRLERLLREFALVARMTASYVRDPIAVNLVSFPARDSTTWQSASWRDSNAGYAGGRFAMDVNAIWAPHALESIGSILRLLPSLGISLDSLGRALPALAPDTPLGIYARDSTALNRATSTWWGAGRHFLVRLSPDEIRSHVMQRLNALPAPERVHWNAVLDSTRGDRDSLEFLALSLDGQGRPIGIANSDPATRLFLGDAPGSSAASVESAALRDVRLFVRAYPVGLFIDRVGPVVATDTYAAPSIWPEFERDRYHGPRVVWGREVNLFLLGAANHVGAAVAPGAYSDELRAAIARVSSAVESSGFHSELWSYEVQNGRAVPVRYSSGSDVQLWSTTDLAVQFALSRLVP